MICDQYYDNLLFITFIYILVINKWFFNYYQYNLLTVLYILLKELNIFEILDR